jgi:nicotinamide-nucleotide amidase
MRAAILSIGDELTLGQNVDTNSAWLSARLAERSIITVEHRTLCDDRQAIAAGIAELATRCDVLIISGGLGPTADDLTREALGDVMTPGIALEIDDVALRYIASIFSSRGREMPRSNQKQALRPASARMLPNPHGTAPGLAGEVGDCRVFSLPGPPREMQPMFFDHVAPQLITTAPDQVLLTAQVQEFGMGESVAAERLGDLMDRNNNPLVGTTVSDAIVFARIRVHGDARWASTQIEQTVARIEQAWHPYVFGSTGATLAEDVGEMLRHSKTTLAVAESCTGGWLGKMIVDVPKSSDYFIGGFVTYSNAMKSRWLDVPQLLIDQHGAVSLPVAEAMATGALRASGADHAIAITGIAGPDGGTVLKPVGTVHIAIAAQGRAQRAPHSRHFVFPGDRLAIRDRAAKAALQMLRFALIEAPENTPLLWEAASRPSESRVPA